jgi:hypothetical protein
MVPIFFEKTHSFSGFFVVVLLSWGIAFAKVLTM